MLVESHANNLLKWLVGLQGVYYSTSAAMSMYVGLASNITEPTGEGLQFTEFSNSEYHRALIGYNSMTSAFMQSANPIGWSISAGIASNTASIMFPECTTEWGTATYFGIFSYPSYISTVSATSIPVLWGTLTSSVTISGTSSSSFIPLFREGAFKLAFDRAVNVEN